MPSLSVIGAAVGGYQIVAPLGVGGTGAVYLAEQPLLGRRAAVKILHPGRASNVRAVARFLDETRAVQALDHPGAVEVLELTQVTTAAGELPCVVMELLEGRSLAEAIADDGAFGAARAVVIAEQVAEVLVAAHARGIVHRDLKTENVFLLSGRPGLEQVKVLDFGIGRLLPAENGTPAYLAPEQCAGAAGDERADVYALGALLFEMLTGRPPIAARHVGDMIVRHLSGSAPLPSSARPGVPPALDAIVARALQKAPERRFPSMAALLQALRDPAAYLEEAERPAAPRPQPPRLAPLPPVRRPERPRGVIALCAAAAVALALVGALAWGARKPVVVRRAAVVAHAKVTLTVAACAPGARVRLDGRDVGPAGASFPVARGRAVAVEVRAPGYLRYERVVIADHDTLIEPVLVPRPREPSIL